MMEERVCCMCGDVGFSDKLFRCGHCHHRSQHSYCSNYYNEFAEPLETCDWCRKLSRVAIHGGSPSKKASPSVNYKTRSEYSSEAEIKHSKTRQDQVGKSSTAGAGGSVASPKTATRRYKLLKDVMC